MKDQKEQRISVHDRKMRDGIVVVNYVAVIYNYSELNIEINIY